MNSVFFRGTGKIAEPGYEAKPFEVVRNNEICEAQFLSPRNVSGRSIFVDGNNSSGQIDARLNAVGDVADSATGYQIAIDTLTYIKKQLTEQKFYTTTPSDYIPVVVGDGAFASDILTNRTYEVADGFETGNLRTGASDSRLASVDVAVDGVSAYVQNWAKGIQYTIFDVEQALRANNWDIIERKHAARKKNWDLGIQKIAFLGSDSDTRIPGLLTNTSINTNTSLITSPISQLNAAGLQTFVTTLIQTYFANTNSTAMPNRFVIPYGDWTGLPALTTGTVGTYPVPLIEYLTKAFQMAVAPMEKDFKIMPLAYCDAANNPAGLHYYMLYRDDAESVRMDIPVPYTTTQANSLNNFAFSDTAYGQYTGTNVYRNLEVLRFQY